jgi:Ser/Thr protein kinase RdoA (MazF antagonist)
VTHNDTKLNNVLFDRKTRKALCVIDLDTVMPGLSATDFGDAIRFGASTAAEDERDPDKVHFSLPLYTAYAEGYLSACGDVLSPGEIEALPIGARIITLEQGLRFLTDYLSGDTYYHIHYEKQNLDRCRTQFKLLAEMEQQQEAMGRIIRTTLSP